MLLGIICTLFGITGIIGAFLGIFSLVIVGAILDLFENFINFITGAQTNILTLIFAVCLGAGYAFILTPLYWQVF